MTSVNKLLAKARECCSASSDAAFAERIGVTRQLVSQWRKGATPIPDERIAQLARLCKDDPAQWLVAVRAEQSHGEAAKAWASLARRLGAAAAVACAAVALPYLTPHADSIAATLMAAPMMHYANFALAVALIATTLWSSRGRSAAPLLA